MERNQPVSLHTINTEAGTPEQR